MRGLLLALAVILLILAVALGVEPPWWAWGLALLVAVGVTLSDWMRK